MNVTFEGRAFDVLPDETVLEAIERQGGDIPSYCRRGICQVCMLRAVRGTPPPVAQKGLTDGLRQQALFLPCVCKPTGDLEVARHGHTQRFESRVEQVELLSEQVLRVSVSAPPGFVHEAGQYIQLERPSDGLMRPYSIASLPGGAQLELHVARLPRGAMSSWLPAAVGEPIGLRGPFGECFYLPDEPERPLCLAGTGTGLAPLLGVVRAAIAAGHHGPIRLFHGSVRREGLYLWAELRALLARAPQLSVVGSLLEGGEPSAECEPATYGSPSTDLNPDAPRCSILVAPLDQALLGGGLVWSEHRVYLCGHHDVVRRLQRKLYLAGVPLARIHADPFVAPGLAA
jgi:CDP-4-dehydro-6-deoxyglucose reductase